MVFRHCQLFSKWNVDLAFTYQLKKKLLHEAKFYYWAGLNLYRREADQTIRKCMPEYEVTPILSRVHASTHGGHSDPNKIAAKVLQCDFFWQHYLRITTISSYHKIYISMSR